MNRRQYKADLVSWLFQYFRKDEVVKVIQIQMAMILRSRVRQRQTCRKNFRQNLKKIYIRKVRIYKYVWVFIWSVAILYSTDVNWSTNYARYFFGQATNVIRRRMDKIDVLNISPERWCNLSWQHRNFASHFLECQNRQYHH